MKRLFFSCIVASCSFVAEKSAAQIGEAVVFEYDNIGNRIHRQYFSSISLIKEGHEINRSMDTVQRSGRNIIVKAYPNPVAAELTIENDSWNDNNKVEVRLFDITGKHILSHPFSRAKDNISFAGLASGTYQVHYYLNGSLLTMWKVVKQ